MDKNNVMSRLCGFIITILLSIVIFFTTWDLDPIYRTKIHLITALIVLIWSFLLIKAKGFKEYKNIEIVISTIIFLGIALYMGSLWHIGYITNTPLAGINAAIKGFHRDTLYHSAITSSINYYGYPSLLVNSAAFHNYHIGSHIIFAAISKITGLLAIFVYCYIYPIIFFPLYASMIISVGSSFKKIVSFKEKISVPDLIVILTFITYFLLPKDWSDNIANRKTSWLISESYCVAIVLSLIFIKLWFCFSQSKFYKNKLLSVLFATIITPLFIAVVSLSKISVGLLLACTILYLLFRKKDINIRYLLLGLGYIGVVFLIHYMFSGFYSPIQSGTTEGLHFYLFHYISHYVKPSSLWGMYILFYFLAFVFFIYRLKDIDTFDTLIKKIKNKELIAEETLFLICIFGALPGLLFAIGGGSAFYFNSIQQIVAAILLIGYSVPEELFKNFDFKKSWIIRVTTIFVTVCICLNFIVSSITYATKLVQDCLKKNEQSAENINENSYWDIISEINKITEGHKKEYYIYISPSANIWEKYSNKDSAIFFYPAMTGIVCIGSLYFENGQLYTNDGTPKIGGYSYKPSTEEQKLTKESAYQKAKKDGKKAIIYLYENKMSIVNIE